MVREERLDPRDFRRFVELNAAPAITLPDPDRRARLLGLIETTEALLEGDTRSLLAALPREIAERMGDVGWLWNGFYYLHGTDELCVGPAHGPPVCASVTRHGGVMSSGMCFDALSLNQTLVAHDVKAWPGYHSCDAESGLDTVAGIVAPIRDARARPIAVWDLDSTEPVLPGDVRFMDVFFATLASCRAITNADFEA